MEELTVSWDLCLQDCSVFWDQFSLLFVARQENEYLYRLFAVQQCRSILCNSSWNNDALLSIDQGGPISLIVRSRPALVLLVHGRQVTEEGYKRLNRAMILHVRFKGNRNDGCNRATHCLSDDSLLLRYIRRLCVWFVLILPQWWSDSLSYTYSSFTLNTSPGVKQIHKYAHPGLTWGNLRARTSRAASVTLTRVSQPPPS